MQLCERLRIVESSNFHNNWLISLESLESVYAWIKPLIDVSINKANRASITPWEKYWRNYFCEKHLMLVQETERPFFDMNERNTFDATVNNRKTKGIHGWFLKCTMSVSSSFFFVLYQCQMLLRGYLSNRVMAINN